MNIRVFAGSLRLQIIYLAVTLFECNFGDYSSEVTRCGMITPETSEREWLLNSGSTETEGTGPVTDVSGTLTGIIYFVYYVKNI